MPYPVGLGDDAVERHGVAVGIDAEALEVDRRRAPAEHAPWRVSGSGARLASAPSTVMRTVASSHRAGVPVV